MPWTEDLINRFHEHIDTTWLAANRALPWSEKLVEQLKGELDWNFLSRNETLPLSISLIERFAEHWSWGAHGLSSNEAVTLPSLSRSQIVEVMQSWLRKRRENNDYVNSLVRTINNSA